MNEDEKKKKKTGEEQLERRGVTGCGWWSAVIGGRTLKAGGSAGLPWLRERWPSRRDKDAVAVVTEAALGLERTATGLLGWLGETAKTLGDWERGGKDGR
ncbi:hypothetical protein E2C01_020702 [Portunus trituberculatus]|uniref:Uncharacterized protein n=1 Tax=Portunus trituberculatus TaxID=210409 RepID=A0A5B7E0V9_PORTR|nr:hypothetical protein [Portunus trituberculatus]